MSNLSDSELEELVNDLESDRVERKSSLSGLSGKGRVCEAICAFANDLSNSRLPGIIFIGIDDNGNCADLPITDSLLLELSDLKSNGNIYPFPIMAVEKKILKGCECAVVIVTPSIDTPLSYRGRVCIRVGPRRGIATPADEGILTEKRKYGNLPYDLYPMKSASIDDDLDLGLFKKEYLATAVDIEIIEQNQRSDNEQLASLRFVSDMQTLIPTVIGILTLGVDPVQHIPGAYIQFLRIDGEELTDPIKDTKKISGPVSSVLRIMDEVVEAHISVSIDVTAGSTEVQRPDYPIVALQQIIRNAVLHRNYKSTNAPVRVTWFKNRIEVHNPGGPYGQVRVENFGTPGVTDYRNPHLAEVLRNLGYVQKFGLGISLAQKEMEKNGNPPIEFKAVQDHCLVVLRKSK